MYNATEFKDDASSLGYEINVYQESINKYFSEYLVNFDYFKDTLEHYGFIPIEKEEYIKFNLPGPINSFSELFKNMKLEVESKRLNRSEIGSALNLSSEEKEISYLNNYFVFKKIRNPDPVVIRENMIKKYNQINFDKNTSNLKKSSIIPKRQDVKKLKKKIKLP